MNRPRYTCNSRPKHTSNNKSRCTSISKPKRISISRSKYTNSNSKTRYLCQSILFSYCLLAFFFLICSIFKSKRISAYLLFERKTCLFNSINYLFISFILLFGNSTNQKVLFFKYYRHLQLI